MGHRYRSISQRCLAGGLALAAAGSAHAAELFPYNPPPASAARQMQQQRIPEPQTGLSAEELRRLDALAREVAKLPEKQRRTLRTEVQNELDKAAARYDVRQVRYYNELLRRIDSVR